MDEFFGGQSVIISEGVKCEGVIHSTQAISYVTACRFSAFSVRRSAFGERDIVTYALVPRILCWILSERTSVLSDIGLVFEIVRSLSLIWLFGALLM